MLNSEKLLIGKANDQNIYLESSQLNRHGIIAGATGTGKTVTLKVIAEALSDIGVPSVIADVKGDLTGMVVEGDQSLIQSRIESMKLDGFQMKKYPVHFYDVYQEHGHPLRCSLQEMDPLLLSRMLSLTEVQQGVLNIVFRIAQDMNLDIIDLKDLQAMCAYVGENNKDLTIQYGNVSTQSIGAIQRRLLELENQGGNLFFGMPSLDISDWFMQVGGKGVMNILECSKLYRQPLLYSTFLLFMLNELYEYLPEAGDLEKPKIAFFFDEAHLLFDDAPKELIKQVEQTVKLIRSKGVAIFFVTQSPIDIPEGVLAQLSNRIQHSLRAYTPKEIKAVKMAADAFRANEQFDTAEMICNMPTGTALVSVLDEHGVPSVVELVKIVPPHSSMEIIDEKMLNYAIQHDSIYGKYEKEIDPESAYEEMMRRKQHQQQLEIQTKTKKTVSRNSYSTMSETDRIRRKATNKLETEIVNFGFRSAKKFLRELLK